MEYKYVLAVLHTHNQLQLVNYLTCTVIVVYVYTWLNAPQIPSDNIEPSFFLVV